MKKNFAAFVIRLLAYGVAVAHSRGADIFTLTDRNSSASVNVGSSAGMYNWTVDGANQLNQQWFWYALGNNAPAPINSLALSSVVQADSSSLKTSYTSSALNLSVNYNLHGGTPGSGVSDIGESITLDNVSSSAITVHFYQYSDFNLVGSPSGDSVELSKLHGLFIDAYQTHGALALSETVTAPGANHGEAELFGVTLAKLNGSAPVTLNDSATSAGPGDVTWALQWDLTIGAGGSVIISKDKNLQVLSVPEPSATGLLALGFLGYLAKRIKLGTRI